MQIEFDVKYGLSGLGTDLVRAGRDPNRNRFLTQDEGVQDETMPIDFSSIENMTEGMPTSLPLTTSSPGIGPGYKLVQIEAAGFASYHTVTDQKGVMLVKNLRNRLVVTLPQVNTLLVSITIYLWHSIFRL